MAPFHEGLQAGFPLFVKVAVSEMLCFVGDS